PRPDAARTRSSRPALRGSVALPRPRPAWRRTTLPAVPRPPARSLRPPAATRTHPRPAAQRRAPRPAPRPDADAAPPPPLRPRPAPTRAPPLRRSRGCHRGYTHGATSIPVEPDRAADVTCYHPCRVAPGARAGRQRTSERAEHAHPLPDTIPARPARLRRRGADVPPDPGGSRAPRGGGPQPRRPRRDAARSSPGADRAGAGAADRSPAAGRAQTPGAGPLAPLPPLVPARPLPSSGDAARPRSADAR